MIVYNIPHDKLPTTVHPDPVGKVFRVIQRVILPSFHNQGYWSDLGEGFSGLREGDLVYCKGRSSPGYGDCVWLQEEPNYVINLRHLQLATPAEAEAYRLQFVHCNED